LQLTKKWYRIKWYSTYYHQCLKAPPIDYYTSNGNGIARTDDYDAGAGWWTLYKYTIKIY
jgi:hypothetical protein